MPDSVTLVLNANTSPVKKFSNYYVPFTFQMKNITFS